MSPPDDQRSSTAAAGPRLRLVVGAGRAPERVAAAHAAAWLRAHPGAVSIDAPPAAAWPFLHPLALPPAGPAVIRVAGLHEAAINRQTGGTRLVTTQLPYLMEVWRAALADRGDVLFVATADADLLREHAPEALARRGPFRHVDVEEAADPADAASDTTIPGTTAPVVPVSDVPAPDVPAPLAPLAAAFRAADPVERLTRCVEALAEGRTAPALVAAASACMEVNDLEAAARDLDEALTLAPDWGAAWFERGKLWLRTDDMVRASEAFRAAADRLPGFVPAWANLGATCGELDRPAEALAAFEHAYAHDPDNHQVLNNIGVVNRELGRLAESEAAFRRVIAATPDLAFGYYNLGHTLFLEGRYQAALTAYGEGQRRDPERNPVQATRLALCRLATDDGPGALRDLQQATAGLPRDYRRQVLADAHAITWALLTHKPGLSGWPQVNAWLGDELKRLG